MWWHHAHISTHSQQPRAPAPALFRTDCPGLAPGHMSALCRPPCAPLHLDTLCWRSHSSAPPAPSIRGQDMDECDSIGDKMPMRRASRLFRQPIRAQKYGCREVLGSERVSRALTNCTVKWTLPCFGCCNVVLVCVRADACNVRRKAAVIHDKPKPPTPPHPSPRHTHLGFGADCRVH